MIAKRRRLIASLSALPVAMNLGPAAAQTPEKPLRTDPDTERRRMDNLALMQRYAEAWRAGDLKALIDCYDDAFTLHYFGNHSLAGTHSGKPAALKALAAMSRKANRRLIAVLDVMASAERGMLIAREAFERGGEMVELERLFLYTTADGRLRECWIYDRDQRLVDRFLG